MPAVSAVHLIGSVDAAPAQRRSGDSVPPSGVTSTDRRLLDRARHLATEFPSANLRPIALIRTEDLDARARGRVWIALEALQTTGSFKVRGALLALDELRQQGHRRVVAASAGNHGAGVAHAARVLGMEADVFVPSNTPQKKRQRIQRGARLVVAESPHYDAAEREARAFAAAAKLPFLSPYDDPAIIAGNGASMGFEIVADLGRVPSRVLVPVCGGGLATGVSAALHIERERTGSQNDVRIYGVQSEASPAFAMSVQSGCAVETLELDRPTLAEGLEGGISRAAFERTRAALNGVMVVTEESIARAMIGIHTGIGLYVEGSGAAALAPLLDALPDALRPETEDDDLVVLLTGGNVDDDRFAALREEYGDFKLW
ncbi:threonine/serine dehydratase [soil metagenome]